MPDYGATNQMSFFLLSTEIDILLSIKHEIKLLWVNSEFKLFLVSIAWDDIRRDEVVEYSFGEEAMVF